MRAPRTVQGVWFTDVPPPSACGGRDARGDAARRTRSRPGDRRAVPTPAPAPSLAVPAAVLSSRREERPAGFPLWCHPA
ncbi:hypothetical protein GCM10011374_20940 [Kocuria dechangensis]|uniref:Uncharacterized protein n=1 Tax=Kocuria dechangensis TaxID=1176249 RepID=A0A917LVL0_9MICC|nr:hypothetical protein GCM10011374_20940 [Kocuria dechangensis]